MPTQRNERRSDFRMATSRATGQAERPGRPPGRLVLGTTVLPAVNALVGAAPMKKNFDGPKPATRGDE